MKHFHLAREHGVWHLRNVQTGQSRPFGFVRRHEAIRRSVALLKSSEEKSCLRIFSSKGEVQAERIFEGRRHLN